MESSKALPTGTAKGETQATILQAQLNKLQVDKDRMKEEGAAYLAKHPEIKVLMDELMASILEHRPADIPKFAAQFFNEKHNPQSGGPPPVVFAGPSGVGKGTLVGLLMKRLPTVFGFSVSHTTRAPRPGEVDGQHYHFVDKSAMEFSIHNGDFIEYANVHTNIYGTSYKAVTSVRSTGKICILDIDIQGVRNVKKSDLDCRYMFIAPPSFEALEERLRGRATESEDKIKLRLEAAEAEIHYGKTPGNFDAIIVNADLETAYSEVVSYLRMWYPDQMGAD
jgi:guanylate kinase